jgi:hypothetical protein
MVPWAKNDGDVWKRLENAWLRTAKAYFPIMHLVARERPMYPNLEERDLVAALKTKLIYQMALTYERQAVEKGKHVCWLYCAMKRPSASRAEACLSTRARFVGLFRISLSSRGKFSLGH